MDTRQRGAFGLSPFTALEGLIMADTISQVEATPAAYATENHDAIWQRIEAHVAHRWTERSVVWIVDGSGHWRAPLTPALITTSEAWRNGAYEGVTLEASPMGGLVLPVGTYRITATVGADNAVPAIVMQAFERLRDYIEAEDTGVPGASSYSINLGQISENYRRNPEYVARALEMSGAADLLRQYRRA